MLAVDERIQKALQLFFPSVEPMEGIVTLLLEKARRTYLKYKIINELLQSKYNMQFDEFSKSKFMEEPSFEVEQDFFDWDMAITGMGDMVSEIKHLESML